MSFKKRATKSIALALIGVTIATPMLNTASAMENSNYGLSNDKIRELKKEANEFDENTSIEELYSEDQVKLMKKEFHDMFGNENEFKEIYNEENVKSEVNGATGDIRITTVFDGKEEVLILNYFDGIEYQEEIVEQNMSLQNRATTVISSKTTGGPDKLNINVVRDTKDRIKATSVFGNVKSYSKTKGDWNSGHTRSFYSSIVLAGVSWNLVEKNAGKTAIRFVRNVIASAIAAGTLNITLAQIKAALAGVNTVAGISATASAAITYVGNLSIAQANHIQI